MQPVKYHASIPQRFLTGSNLTWKNKPGYLRQKPKLAVSCCHENDFGCFCCCTVFSKTHLLTSDLAQGTVCAHM